MAKKNFDEMSKKILENVGSKDNIISVAHCATRLRFNVKDKSIVKINEIEKISGVMGSQWSGDQFQIIIGGDVPDVYKAICKVGNLELVEAIDENLDTHLKGKKFGIRSIFEALSDIVVPLIPVFCAGGMIKCLVTVLTSFNIVAADSSILAIISAIGDAPFYFMPFMFGYTTAKKCKINETFGIMIAGILMYPTLVNQTIGETIPFLFFDIPSLNYSSTAFPVLLTVVFFSYFYRFVDKLIPKNFSLVFTGLIAFCIYMPIALMFIAPFGTYLSVGVASGLMFLFDLCGPITGALYSGLLSFFIMTGLHVNMIPIILQNIQLYGSDYLIVATFINNIAVAGSTLGYALTLKDKTMKSMGISAGIIALCGVSEPALFGMGIKYRKPLIANIIGGAVGGAVFMALGVTCSAFAFQSLFSLPLYTSTTANLVGILISIGITFIVSFIAAFILGKRERKEA